MTNNNAVVNFRLPQHLKTEAFEVIAQYGLTPSQVFNMFLTEIVATKAIPLSLNYLQPNTKTLMAMNEIENGKAERFSLDANTDLASLLKQKAEGKE
ncbi:MULTISPECIES: type II toxin-antitoxin system RelB/DinJ family antitoxin [unclassified Avibacterium]|uniref:type II toxin-antitoxin system RelB/DinJ family antitoxin n=1 Tax=unclassified Avibacterium TaxID=2685287 RepID=UPI00218AC104|nr:type II toxin-antitoxin system RelB/DinJ family antitoxin [Avibacterium sp. 20-129]MCW9699457.1 type II toxin-antitoxin system RelB/DinJ family antitoxin [Avibacterium sp. 20-129]URL03105.1 type II toxin-antitoxin system RelB/DinJ family antitoxin [Avibacterium sp. 20-126]